MKHSPNLYDDSNLASKFKRAFRKDVVLKHFQTSDRTEAYILLNITNNHFIFKLRVFTLCCLVCGPWSPAPHAYYNSQTGHLACTSHFTRGSYVMKLTYCQVMNALISSSIVQCFLMQGCIINP